MKRWSKKKRERMIWKQHGPTEGEEMTFEQFKSLAAHIIHDGFAALENAASLGTINSTDFELLKVLGSVNSTFDPARLVPILLPESAGSTSVISKLVDLGKSVSHRGMTALHIGEHAGKDASEGLTTKQHHAITNALGDDELSATFESEPMLMWVQKSIQAHGENAADQLLHYIQTNQALREWVSDCAKSSVYAHNNRAAFFRSMMEWFPFVLDALLESSSMEAQRFAAVMDWMYAARMRHSNEGSLSRLVVPIDRAPLMRYLADSTTDSKSRAVVLSLLREIWRVFAGDRLDASLDVHKQQYVPKTEVQVMRKSRPNRAEASLGGTDFCI